MTLRDLFKLIGKLSDGGLDTDKVDVAYKDMNDYFGDEGISIDHCALVMFFNEEGLVENMSFVLGNV